MDTPTTDTPKFDDCKELAVFWADSYERRRAVEWKLSLGLWAVILTGVSSADKLREISGWPLVLWSIANTLLVNRLSGPVGAGESCWSC